VSDGREYLSHPRVGVGAVVLDGPRVLLVRRGKAPSYGKWSLPGGMVELGETTREAVQREIEEECSLKIQVLDVCGVLDRVVRDAEGRIRYHWVLVDYVAFVESGTLCAASDADEAAWVEVNEVARLDTTDGLLDMIRRAQALAERRRP
jgi:ADP-ribose pyrophosphatase YjhB (NUDIX family)